MKETPEETPQAAETPFRCGFVSLIGRPNVGKSTLLNRILGQKLSITADKPQTTRNRILGIYSSERMQALLLDTPGIHAARGRLNRFMVDQALTACAGVELALYVITAQDRFGEEDERILQLLQRNGLKVILVINKIDRVTPEVLLPLIDSYCRSYPFSAVVPLSALKGQGVDILLDEIYALLPLGAPLYPDDQLTDVPERFIAAELIREKVLRRVHQEVPYGVAVQVERFEERPERQLVVIQAVIYVEREAHKRILLGKGGSMIRNLGTQARQDIEKLLDARVFLDLFVKVQPNWTQSDRCLRDLGYL
ncbi:GTPase Era [Desulfuromonas thiophila]|uniref:GTPase Era n=1 Tax=Desulfuromonas thiophila TaxID=57664 RepID=A0A1G7AL94_9BACT|nr:GTPase Era [Desulfuromonas thiophila]MDD3800691.1 GTPase Era [Desulfuromonas thiophila]SDE15619.1 GTP-binding protein Era [Desulfuromonas thiophila]